MYVKRITENKWSGVRNQPVEYECSSVEEALAAIGRLNGRNKTSVDLDSDGTRSFSVGGGNDGRYIAFVTIGVDDEFYNLIDSKQPEDLELDVVTGGQWGTFPARHILGLDMVLEAARQFAIDGTMSPSLEWEKQVEA